MLERLNLYDLLSTLVPGALFVSVVVTLFPELAVPVRAAGLPSEFSVVALLAVSLLAGEVVQTLGSMLEPALFRVFGGRPSDQALAGKLASRYFPRDAATRIKAKLAKRVGGEASSRSLFLTAMNLAESTQESKAATFNAQYGHHRAITTLFILTLGFLIASRNWGAARTWGCSHYWVLASSCLGLLALFARRTWQRGVYYSREVLFAAERLIDSVAATGTDNSTSTPKGD